uniref:Pre-C2HC domain-containing protein n=1 Tax=Trichogramma kaykai TaxID=54128 RepID=A0ABD2VUV6_9HYME
MNIEFITFTPKETKPKSILLKGMHDGTSSEDVLKALTKLTKNEEKINFIKIEEFKGKPKNGVTFLIQIEVSDNLKILTNINCVNHQITKYVNPSHRQCRRCQRIAHVASNCNMEYKYVKCIEKHPPDQCKVTKENKQVHPASYKGCLVRITKIEKIKAKNRQAAPNDRKMSYANIVASNQRHGQSTNPMTLPNRGAPKHQQYNNNQQQQGSSPNHNDITHSHVYDPASNNDNINNGSSDPSKQSTVNATKNTTHSNNPSYATRSINNQLEEFISSKVNKPVNEIKETLAFNEQRLSMIENKFSSVEQLLTKVKTEICTVIHNENTSLHTLTQENAQKINYILKTLNWPETG